MKAETKLAKILATEDSDTKLVRLWLLGCSVLSGCQIAKAIEAENKRLINAGFRFTRGARI